MQNVQFLVFQNANVIVAHFLTHNYVEHILFMTKGVLLESLKSRIGRNQARNCIIKLPFIVNQHFMIFA